MDWANLVRPKASRKGYGLAPPSSCVLHWLLGTKMKMQPAPQTKKTKILFFKLGPLVGHNDPVPTTPLPFPTSRFPEPSTLLPCRQVLVLKQSLGGACYEGVFKV